MQKVLRTLIGASHQSFVHGRQMRKTVMMMMAVLTSSTAEPDVTAMMSQVILLLDFCNAYDTVARIFIFLALQLFGVSPEFVT